MKLLNDVGVCGKSKMSEKSVSNKVWMKIDISLASLYKFKTF